jgi:hypothetical protein
MWIMNEELWKQILGDLALRTKKPMSMLDKLISIVVGTYEAVELNLMNDEIESTDLVLSNNIHNYLNGTEVDLENLERLIRNYLCYLVWKFPNKKVEPFTLIDSIPEDKYIFITWFIYTTFIQVNKELGILFNGKEHLEEKQLKYCLVDSTFLKGQKFKLKKYLTDDYYFSSITIKFT